MMNEKIKNLQEEYKESSEQLNLRCLTQEKIIEDLKHQVEFKQQFKDNIALFLGDFRDYLKGIANESIDLILTDIPYNISKKSNFMTLKNKQYRVSLEFGEWDKDFDINIINEVIPKLRKGGSLVLFHSYEQGGKLKEILDLEYKDPILWQKSNPMPRNHERRYVQTVEFGSWYVKPKGKWTFNRQNSSFDIPIMKYPTEGGGANKRFHPNQKPIKLIREILLRHSNVGDLVLDPFMGGGTIPACCLLEGRKCIGIDKEKIHFQSACRRLQMMK